MSKLSLVILCGGRGKRLGSLTEDIPKPLLKFKGEPFVEKIIKFYQKFNFEKIYFLAGYKGKKFKSLYNNKKFNFIDSEVIIEKRPLGTGGALSKLKYKINHDFILVNGDSFIDYNFPKFIKKNKFIGKMLLVKNQNYKSNNKLTSLNIKNKKVFFDKKSNYMNAGVYLFKKKIFRYIPNSFSSLEKDILPKLINSHSINGVKLNVPFIDMGTKQNYRRVNKFFNILSSKPALFLDRDGVINEDLGYVHRYSDFKWIKKTINLLKKISHKNIYIFIVTNQSGIGRKIYTKYDFFKLQKKIKESLSKKEIYFNDVYYCPHHPTQGKGIFRKNCKCRKPNNLMILNAKKKWNINLKKSLMIGDKLSDELCAKKSKLKFFYMDKNLSHNFKLFYKL